MLSQFGTGIIILLLFLQLPYSVKCNSSSSFGCSNASKCIQRIQKAVRETGRFWFGDQWRFNCAHNSDSRFRLNSVECLNARELINFHSLGSRLFRVNTFTQAFLKNLHIYPQIRFTPQSGSYRACDHDFVVKVNDDEMLETEVSFESAPIAPFQVRQRPTFDWPTLNRNDSYIILMLDAGFGLLKYLAIDFPRATKVVKEYEQVDNFRLNQPTPFVVLVFESPPDPSAILNNFNNIRNNDKTFDLTQFMIDFELDEALIGLNWFLVGADAFAIERQRLKGFVDNCHALIQQKLVHDRRWKFVELFPLFEMDSSLTVSANQPSSTYQACCKLISTSEETIFADPLADRQIPSVALLTQPMISSFRPLEFTDNYQRSQRHYIVLKEERYTLVMFDPVQRYLYWMLVDIPAEALTVGGLNEAVLIAPYIPPIPSVPGECIFPVFMLFKQTASVEMTEFYNNDHIFRSRFCVGHCIYRNSFEIEQFKSFHRLQFSAISWFKVCYDIFEASREIKSILTASNTTERIFKFKKPSIDAEPVLSAVERSNELKKTRIESICSKLLENQYIEKCFLNSSSNSSISKGFLLILVLLLLIMPRLKIAV